MDVDDDRSWSTPTSDESGDGDARIFDIVWDDVRTAFNLKHFADGRFHPRDPALDIRKSYSVSKDVIDVINRYKSRTFNLGDNICRLVQAELNERLRDEIVPAFWARLGERVAAAEDEDDLCAAFPAAVDPLFAAVVRHRKVVRGLDRFSMKLNVPPTRMFGQEDYCTLNELMLRATLHSQLPENDDFDRATAAFYERAFRVFQDKLLENDRGDEPSSEPDNTDTLSCNGCLKDKSNCKCRIIMEEFDETNKRLLEMKCIECLVTNALTVVVHRRIDRYVDETCRGNFTKELLDVALEWLDSVVMKWVQSVFEWEEDDDKLQKFVNEDFAVRLRPRLHEAYARARIEELFKIIVEFSDTGSSEPALLDLRRCVEKANGLRDDIIAELRRIFKVKLLHNGVRTTDILTYYVAAIRALRILDPTGVLLELVCDPIKSYLRSRNDTVRRIVESFIDKGSELAVRLGDQEGLALNDSFYEEDDMSNWESWEPDPSYADPAKHSQSKRKADIISMLVNIYGSKELFVNEYRTILSSRLLTQFTFDTKDEIETLELLKLRFGDAPLQQCDVMLRDISDSKRMNAALHSSPSGSAEGVAGAAPAMEEDEVNDENAPPPVRSSSPVPASSRENEPQPRDPLLPTSSAAKEGPLGPRPFPLQALILSAQFWPKLKDDALELPPEVKAAQEAYTKAYATKTGNRTLFWRPQLGMANIDVELGNRKVNLCVAPIHATIIHKFQEREEWPVEELSRALLISTSALKRGMAFWQTQGFVREKTPNSGVYCLVEDHHTTGTPEPAAGGSGAGIEHLVEADEEEHDGAARGGPSSRDKKKEENLKVYWSYVKNMLINFEAASLENISRMLQMCISTTAGVTELSIEDVQEFLDRKVQDHELACENGQYKLPSGN